MPILTRTWQLLLKGMGEIQVAPNPHAAAEMIVLRLVYAAELPIARRSGEATAERRARSASGADAFTGDGGRSAQPSATPFFRRRR